MSFGVGLGAFMQGVERGYGLGQKMQQAADERDQREKLKGVATEARERYGDTISDESIDFMSRRQAGMMAERGDLSGAKEYQTWSEGREARQGTKLFAQAISAAQNGDVDAAMRATQQLGRLKGYGAQVNLESWSPIKDAEGNVLGHRLVGKGADGKPITQDVPAGKLPEMIARLANPVEAFNQERAQRAETGKSARELGEYEQKKQIDQRYSATSTDQRGRQDAIKALRDNSRTFGPKNAQNFDELNPEQQETEIARELKLQRPAGSVATGAPAGQAGAANAAPGLAARSGPTAGPAAPASAAAQQGQRPAGAPGGPMQGPPQPGPVTRGGYVNEVTGQAMTPQQAQQRAAGIGAVASPSAPADRPAPGATPAMANDAPPMPPTRPLGLGTGRAEIESDNEAARQELAKVDSDIARVTSTSRNETASTALLQPLQTRRAMLQQKLDEAARLSPR